MVITLDQDDLNEADTITRLIEENSKKKNRVFRIDRAKYPPKKAAQWKLDGFRAEKAVSKALGLKWNNHLYSDEEFRNKALRPSDLDGLEVRCTRWKNGCLLLNQTDLPDSKYLLVIVESDYRYRIVGWCYGRDGMKKEYYRQGNYGQACYFVPQSNLRPVEEIMNETEIIEFLIV